PGVLHLRLDRHQRRDHGQRPAAAVPLGPLRAAAGPLRAHRRGGARGARGSGRRDGRRGRAAGVPDGGGRGGAGGAAGHEGPRDRLRQRSPRPARGAARRHRRPRPRAAARGGGLPPLQPAHAGGRVRDRARRRPVRARDREGGRGAHRAVPLRQDPHQHVPRPDARHLRGELPAGGRGPGRRGAAPVDRGPRRPLLRPAHLSRASLGRARRAPGGVPVRLARADPLGAVPGPPRLRRARGALRRLLEQVRRGDVHPHPAIPRPARDHPAVSTHHPKEHAMTTSIRPFSELGMSDLEQVGGKNASLGEMVSNLTRLGVQVPDGFATTADAYREFLGATGLAQRIDERLQDLDTEDTIALAEAGREIRELVIAQPFPAHLEADIRAAYEQLAAGSGAEASFAVRSSATAEDLPDASFAGQQETFLNVRGIDAVLLAIREVFASLYTDRAIAYRVHHDFEHAAVALSAGVQKMVRSDLGASGVMFTMDTESGFDQAVFITSAYGLGEGVVQGAVNPDEFYVYKPGLREDRPAILKRAVGEKATKMVYTQDTTVGRTTEFVPVDPAEQAMLSLTDQQ